MSTIRDLASSGECGQRSALGSLAQHVTQTGQSALQEVRSAAFGPVYHVPGKELLGLEDLLHDHARPELNETQQAFEFEQMFQGESKLVPFSPVDALVEQFQNFSIPDARQNQMMPFHLQPQTMPNPWADHFLLSHPQVSSADAEWVQQFEQQSGSQQTWADEFQSQSTDDVSSGVDSSMLQRLQNCSNEKVRNSKFVQFLARLEKGEIALDEQNNTIKEIVPLEQSKVHLNLDNGWSQEFQAVNDADWAAEFPDVVEGDQNDWVEQFQGPTSAVNDLVHESQNEASEDISEWLDEFENFDWKEYVAAMHRESDQVSKHATGFEYLFANDNPYLESADPMAEGIRLMDQGNLSNAILAFEAEVQHSRDNLNAWRLLGQCNADNESDTQCIAALSTALDLDPYSLESLLMLGVSHANDLDQARALHALKTWIENNPDFQFLSKSNDSQFQEFEDLYGELQSRSSLCAQVIDMYTKAAMRRPNDVNIHTVLGVLYNITGDYERATECLMRAIQLKPDDPRLWNKLGATQANGSHSLAAVQSYKRALELKPNYVRALANLGISFANQGMHTEAAQAYLATLARNPNAEHVWSYLCITLASANCPPEVCALTDRKDVDSFRPYFDF